MTTTDTNAGIQWKPLESNPDSINEYLKKIGVTSVECQDVFSFEPEMLEFLPKPQLAMILCFPDYKKVDQIMAPVYEKLKEEGNEKYPEGMFFMQQKISNACGTFALFHALANIGSKIDIGNGPLAKFLNTARDLGIHERSDLLASDIDLSNAHEAAASAGETEANDDVENHFIAFVNWNGTLYEIDSRAPFPRPLGATTDDTLVRDAGAAVQQQLMSKMDNISFSALALVPK